MSTGSVRKESSRRDWNRLIGELIGCHSDPERLPAKLVEILDALTPDGLSGLLVYRKRGARLEAARFPLMRRSLSYATTEFVDFVNAMLSHEPGCYALRTIAPPRFDATSLFKTLYTNRKLSDEVVHLCKVDDERGIIAGSSRNKRFTKAEIALHDEAFPIISACCTQIVALGSENLGGESNEGLVSVDRALERFGDDLLSPRESDVIHLTLQGHTTESAAQQLGISANTAKHHRVHAYSKLGVSSQGELFYKFLRTLGVPNTT